MRSMSYAVIWAVIIFALSIYVKDDAFFYFDLAGGFAVAMLLEHAPEVLNPDTIPGVYLGAAISLPIVLGILTGMVHDTYDEVQKRKKRKQK